MIRTTVFAVLALAFTTATFAGTTAIVTGAPVTVATDVA